VKIKAIPDKYQHQGKLRGRVKREAEMLGEEEAEVHGGECWKLRELEGSKRGIWYLKEISRREASGTGPRILVPQVCAGFRS
jgi:hypothetical protein